MVSIALAPLLAADASIIIFVIIAALSGINWLMNNLGGNNQQQGGGARPRKQPNRDLQDEIDKFLQEVGGAKPQQQQRKAQRKQINPRTGEPVRKQPSRRPVRQSQPPKPKPKPKVKPKALQKRSEKPVSWEMGDSVRSHVQQHLPSDHLEKMVEQDIGNRIEDSVKSRFGESQDDIAEAKKAASGPANKLVTLLQDPAGVRQAILINEVLSKPLAMRK